jgi:hypothetical protein
MRKSGKRLRASPGRLPATNHWRFTMSTVFVQQYIDGDEGYTAARHIAEGAPGLSTLIDEGHTHELLAPCGCYVVNSERFPSMAGLCPAHQL